MLQIRFRKSAQNEKWSVSGVWTTLDFGLTPASLSRRMQHDRHHRTPSNRWGPSRVYGGHAVAGEPEVTMSR